MISEEKYELLKEGINDVGIFKAVFMAGGPGSGKSAVARKLGITALGLKNVNSDTAFENGLKKANLSLKMPEGEEEQRDAVRQHAKALTAKQQNSYVNGRLGLVIDSTAKNIKFIVEQKKLLEALGYETAMVFVNTELDTALQRNRDRKRSIPDKIVKDSHAVVRSNMGKLQGLFKRRNFYIIDNDGDLKDLEKNATKIYPRLRKFVTTLPKNKMVSAWRDALTMKPTTMKSVKDAMWGKGKHSTIKTPLAAETDYSFKNFISEEAKHITYEDYCFMLDCIEVDLDNTLTEEDKKTWWDKLSRDKQIAYKKNNPKSDRVVKKEPDKKKDGGDSEPEKRGAKHIFNSLKSHISDVTSETGVGVKKIVSSMKQKDVHGAMKAVGYSFETAGKLAYGALRTVDKAVGSSAEALHDTKSFQMLKKGTMKVDAFLDEHPVLKKATGAVVAGAVLAQWYHMSFSGDFESDYDLSAVGGAMAGTYGITDLLATPDGIKGMALLSLGVATGGMSMLWPGGKKGMMLAAAYTGARKLGDTETAQKIFGRMKEMKDAAKDTLKGKDENYINSNMTKLKTFREITEGENVDNAKEKHATERERMKDRHDRELERAREDDFKDSEDNRQDEEAVSEGYFSRIAGDIEDGMKANAIAKKYGVSMKQVQGWIKDYKSTPKLRKEANAVSLSNPDAKKMVGMMQKYVNSKNDKEKQTLMKQINVYQKKLGLKVTEEITEISVDKATGRKKAGTWGRTTGGYGAKAAKKSKRAGSKGARRVAKQSLRQGDVSPEVEKTKEKIYKDLKKKRDYFEKEYGAKADDVMHGTAMNMAKKQHKVESANYTTELSKQMALEALNMQQRRAIGMRMRRQAKKIAKARLRAKKKMAPIKQLMKRAQKQARDMLAKKMAGGKSMSQMSVGQKVAISKQLDKKSAQIQKLAKKKLPQVKKDERERLKRFKAKLADKSI